MSYEALFQAETLRAQQEDERRRAARVGRLRAQRAPVSAMPLRGSRARASAWSWLHLPHRRAARDGVRLA